MKIVFMTLLILACMVFVTVAQQTPPGWQPTQLIDCCIRSVASDSWPECKQMDPLACRQAGGKQVDDCSQCK